MKFLQNKQGREMWQLVLIILALFLLLLVILFYSGLNGEITNLFKKLGGLL